MKIEFYQHLFEDEQLANQSRWNNELKKQLTDIFSNPSHGHFSQWQNTVQQLAYLRTNHLQLNQPSIVIGNPDEITADQKVQIHAALMTLQPWRKGPFNYFGVQINSEWRCDLKWQRVKNILTSLKGKSILDVGCGNGYYMLRMLESGAKSVLGVDPTLIFMTQFYALTQSLENKLPTHLLPLAFEDLPNNMNHFDIIFSMGVLYHRRDPLEHLKRLFSHTRQGGELLLETLIVNHKSNYQLIPEQRYAGMRNVWSVPSPTLIEQWLKQSGYENIQLHNLQTTSIEEQHATAWTKNFSLENFLDPSDASKTIEGHPAPIRAIFSAQKP